MAAQGISPNGRELIGWSTVPVPFATVAIILRFACRRATAGIGKDDWTMLCAVVLHYGLYATIITWAILGKAGWSEVALSSDELEMFLKMYFIIRFIYGGVMTAARVSILLLYRRLFSIVRYIPWTTAIFGTFLVIWEIVTCVTATFACMPLGSFWHRTQDQHCVDTRELFIFFAAFNMIIDLTLLCLPVPIIWKLKISLRHKLYLILVFMLGIFACIAGALRIAYELAVNVDNISGTAAAPIICFSFEAGIAAVTGCMPTLGPLLVRWRPNTNHSGEEGWKRVSLGQGCSPKSSGRTPSPASDHLPKIEPDQACTASQEDRGTMETQDMI